MRPENPRRLQNRQICELVVASRDGSRTEVIYDTTELIEAPNWTPDGKWLIYNADGRLFRISPDGRRGPERIGTVPVENLNNDHVVSPDGLTLFMSANDGHIYRVSIAGGVPRRISSEKAAERGYGHYLHGISPDGRMLAYVGLEREGERVVTRICLVPSEGGADIVLTDGAHPVDGPEFSPDGQWIYFNAEQAGALPGHAQLVRIRPDGTGLEQLTFDERVNWFPHPSPDGRDVVYLSYPPGTTGHPADCDVIVRLLDLGNRTIRDIDRFLGGQGTINVPSWAPDSSAFAYVRYPLRPDGGA